VILLEKHLISNFGITKENAQKITPLFYESELKKGDYFLKRGQYCEKFSFIKSGYIRIFSEYNGKEVTQWISSKNYFVTDVQSFIFKQRARWNIEALTDCELYTINKSNYNLLKSYLNNWDEIEKQFIASCFVVLENRVFDHLSLNTEERYNIFFKNNKELINQVPLQYIASMLGMSPETLSRIRSKKIS